jgi:hypothetical protein
MTTQKFFDLCDTAPRYAEDTAQLFSWCEGNYDFPAPSSLFLDLIGYSEEEHGSRLTAEKWPALGHLELDLIARALIEYSQRPEDVYGFTQTLMNSYTEDEDETDEDETDEDETNEE